MICEPCAAGADVTYADAYPAAARDLAVGLHGKCKKCPCQHRVLSAEDIAARQAAAFAPAIAGAS